MIQIEPLNFSTRTSAQRFILENEHNKTYFNSNLENDYELINLSEYFFNGQFWVAKFRDQIVGTLGLYRLNDFNLTLKKMFINETYNNDELDISQSLLNQALQFAVDNKYSKIWVEVPSPATTLHQFYEKNSFVKYCSFVLPDNFTPTDGEFLTYKLNLRH